MNDRERLPVRVKLGFGVGDLGGNLYFTVIAFWLLNYLTDSVGLAAGLAGVATMIGKIWDAVIDPFLGYFSDRTRSRWGRRRPYIFVGSIALLLAMVAMFTNPRLSNQTGLLIWATLLFCLLSTAFSVVNIPYSSLTPELTKDYHERTSLNGYRGIFMVAGTMLGAGAALPIIKAFPDRNLGFTAMGAIFGALMLASGLICFFAVREPAQRPGTEPKMGFAKTYGYVFRNRPYVLLLLIFVMNMIAVTVVSGMLVYYFKYLFNREGMTTVGLLILLATAMLFIPVCVRVSGRIGKKLTYAVGMSIVAAACLLIFFLGHILGLAIVLIMMFVAGIGLSVIYPIPWAMIPDTVEYGYLQSGERREGGYYGIWTFCVQIGQALAMALNGWVLQLSGFVPQEAQSESARLGIRLLIGPITAAFFLAAALLLAFYPLTETKYREILARIQEREAGAGG